MQKTLTHTFAFLVILLTSQSVFAQEFIYKITADQIRVTTGVKIAGLAGIVTTLHGVAGAGRITVSQITNKEVYDDQVSITAWDLTKDVCVINSTSINAIPLNSGLSVASLPSNFNMNDANVVIKGFPWSVPQYQTINASLDGDHGLESLSNLIPAGPSREVLIKRVSPDIQQTVINLHGALAPGHSGAPILFKDQVIGIVDGGLLNGPGYAWGILYKSVNFVPVDLQNVNYQTILVTNDALFSNEPLYQSKIETDSPPNPSENPVEVLSVTRDNDGVFDFLVKNKVPVDFQYVSIHVRYYGSDLTESFGERGDSEHLPIGQKIHIFVSPPYKLKPYSCIQYDVKIPSYPQSETDYKKTYLLCDFK